MKPIARLSAGPDHNMRDTKGMPVKTSAPRLFVRNKGYGNNTVLNWHREPEKEFHLYGDAFWDAARRLLQNDELDRSPRLV